MRASKRLATLALSMAAIGAAGCGVSGTPAAHQVNLSISAPISGATVGVHEVTVEGTVVPSGAQVSVNGQAAQVSGATFTRTLYVTGRQTITVTGQARGYAVGHASTTILVQPNVSAPTVALSASLMRTPPSPAGPKVTVSSASLAALDSAFQTPGSGSGSHHSSSSSHGNSSGGSSGSSGTGNGGSSGGSSGTGNGGSGGSSTTPTTPSGGANPVPPPAPTLTPAQIKSDWEHGCLLHAAKGTNVVPFCTCLYNHLAYTGSLSSQQRAEALMRELRTYNRTGLFSKLPKFMQKAMDACYSKLPASDPIGGGKATLTPFPGHPSNPGGSETQTTPGETTSTPTTSTPGP
jgi:hypothetical protein